MSPSCNRIVKNETKDLFCRSSGLSRIPQTLTLAKISLQEIKYKSY